MMDTAITVDTMDMVDMDMDMDMDMAVTASPTMVAIINNAAWQWEMDNINLYKTVSSHSLLILYINYIFIIYIIHYLYFDCKLIVSFDHHS